MFVNGKRDPLLALVRALARIEAARLLAQDARGGADDVDGPESFPISPRSETTAASRGREPGRRK